MSEEMTDPVEQTRDNFLRRHRTKLMVGVPLIVVLIGLYVWVTGGRYASTDDAFVQTGRVQISANISGHVVELAVHENQRVHKGDLLFRIDPSAPQAALAQAEAELRSAQAQVGGAQASYRQQLATLAAAESTLAFRRREAERNRGLQAAGVVSREEADQAQHDLELAAQQLAAARQAVGVAAANLGAPVGAPVGASPSVQRAAALLERARLTQSDTIVRAPQDGVVTRVSQLQVGSYVQASQPVFILVNDELWVEANFKEGDLAHMRPGQTATVKVDAYPDLKLTAKVQSLSPGTGSSFALLPAENATGNWVKVVQRVPVRLVFAKRPERPLQGGLSAVVKVDTEHRRFGGDRP